MFVFLCLQLHVRIVWRYETCLSGFLFEYVIFLHLCVSKLLNCDWVALCVCVKTFFICEFLCVLCPFAFLCVLCLCVCVLVCVCVCECVSVCWCLWLFLIVCYCMFVCWNVLLSNCVSVYVFMASCVCMVLVWFFCFCVCVVFVFLCAYVRLSVCVSVGEYVCEWTYSLCLLMDVSIVVCFYAFMNVTLFEYGLLCVSEYVFICFCMLTCVCIWFC